MTTEYLAASADISEDGVYRYRLVRRWADPLHHLPFIMLNPSTADGLADDPTIRRCVGFAKAHGYTGIAVYNLYAYRATDPLELWSAQRDGVDIVGPDNDRRLTNLFTWAQEAMVPIVAAWGANAKLERVNQIIGMPGAELALWALGETRDGAPRHPLYLRSDAILTPWPDRSWFEADGRDQFQEDHA